MTTRVGINGFGRIGRNFFRAAAKHDDLEIVALNDLTDAYTLGHLLRYDSIHGPYPGSVEPGDDKITVDGSDLAITAERNPANIPWKDFGVEVVIESTGLFTKRSDAAGHLDGGARKVIISAPGKEEDVTVVLGGNESDYDPSAHDVISNASCTTNSVVPMAKVLDEAFGIEQGFMTTAHAYTNDQALHDGPHKDLRRARAGAMSIIPTTTGAARAASKSLPQLEGRLDGLALRVPVPDGSITDMVLTLRREATADEVNDAYRAAAANELAGILEYTEDPIVSTDIVGNPHSCIIDGGTTMASGRMVKVLGWYDNEWGYSCRLADLTAYVGDRLQ